MFGKKRSGAKKPGPPVHDDLCAVVEETGRTRHAFIADDSNRLWIGDITEHWTNEGKLYLCAFKDVHSNRIVGYSIDSRMKSQLAVTALNNAVARRGDVAGCVSTPTEGRNSGAGNSCRPWAVTTWSDRWAESARAATTPPWRAIFSLLQKNVLNRRTWATREDLRIAIGTWIERTYHRRRRQDRLGRQTPGELETIMTTPAVQAA